MLIDSLRVVRTSFRVLWIGGMIALIALVAMPHVVGVFGRQVYIVRGASMSPEIQIGAVVLIDHVDRSQIKTGDVITFRVGSGNVVTHRVTAVLGDSELSFSTKGDASNSADPVPVPADAVLGRVQFSVPAIGLVMTTLSSTAGMIVVFGIFGTLLLGGWFIDELVATLVPGKRRGAVAEHAA
jgi:signal peptidase